MTTGEIIIALLLAVVIFLQLRKPKSNKEELEQLKKETGSSIHEMAALISQGQNNMNELVSQKVEIMSQGVLERQEQFRKTLDSSALRQEERLKTFSAETEQKLENIRGTLEQRLRVIQDDNSKKLDDMRKVVDEKLQTTINTRMTESFKLVNDRLEQVYKGLGEMQSLASGVGDLKKALTNVKTRGILGEIQLGAILEDILSPEQYETNCRVKKGSANAVEFAVKIPSQDGDFIYLPIDAKFPGDTYNALIDAYEGGDKAEIDNAAKALCRRIKDEAKDISTKYIYPPETTEFAVMFLPFEGLYAEVVNRGLLEELQRTYRVTVAGPSTMSAMLCSIRMCFKNAAIQRCSDEVWKVLGAVKTEFATFEKALTSTQDKINKVSDELDKLIGVRTRAINRKLKNVTELDLAVAEDILQNDENLT